MDWAPSWRAETIGVRWEEGKVTHRRQAAAIALLAGRGWRGKDRRHVAAPGRPSGAPVWVVD